MTSKKRKKSTDDLIQSLVEDLKKESHDPTALLPTADAASSSTFTLPASGSAEEKTIPISQAVGQEKETSIKPSLGVARFGGKANPGPADLALQQAENLRIAQQRILDLEQHLEKMRGENEQLASVADIAKNREEELLLKIQNLERSKADLKDQSLIEINILKDNYQNKEFESSRLKMRVEELEGRLQADLKKIRVRERELENRLELLKVEKNALIRAKDESILDLKRKMDQLYAEIEMYKQKVIELNQRIEFNNDQFSRTVRALRLALTSLETAEPSAMSLTPLKKAE